MADKRWLGGAAGIARSIRFTVTGVWAAGDTVKFTLGLTSFTVTIGTLVTIDQVIVTLQQAYEGSTFTDTTATVNISPQNIGTFVELDATLDAGNDYFILTVTDKDIYFDNPAMLATTAGTGAVSAWTEITAHQGPYDFSTLENWQGGVVLVAGDHLILDRGSFSMKYNIDQNALGSAITIRQEMGWLGELGLPETNESGTSYPEYRPTYFKAPISTLDIGKGTGAGSSMSKYDCDGENVTVTISNSGQSTIDGRPAINIKNTGATSEVNVTKGDVGFCIYDGETGTIKILRLGYLDSVLGDTTFRSGPDATLAGGSFTFEVSGGIATIESATTKINMTDGEVNLLGSGAHAEINVDGGQCYYSTSGTLTQGRVGNGGAISCVKDNRAKTFTNLTLTDGASLMDPHGTIIYSNAIQMPRSGLQGLAEYNFGDDITVLIARI